MRTTKRGWTWTTDWTFGSVRRMQEWIDLDLLGRRDAGRAVHPKAVQVADDHVLREAC